MLKDKIDDVMQSFSLYTGNGGWMPFTGTFAHRAKDITVRDIQVALERKFGWVVPIGAIKAAM
jgi:hypothetical protein